MATLGELAKQSSMAHWSLSGRQQLVKVVSAAGYDYVTGAAGNTTGGYVTEIRYLWGQNNRQIEAILGLREFELKHVAYVFGLARLPQPDEVEFHLSAAFPGGESPYAAGGGLTAAYQAGKTKADRDFAAGRGTTDRSYWPVKDFYPMGSGMVPQWKINPGVAIPVTGLIAAVTQTAPFPRENGSTKPYTPHNRGAIRV